MKIIRKRVGIRVCLTTTLGIMAISNDYASTSASSSSTSEEVAYYLNETTKIIQEWIKKGQNEEEPVSRFTSSKEMRQAVKLSLSDKPCSNEEILRSMTTLLDNSVNPWTGRFVDKLYSTPMPIGIASEALLAAINANAHVISAAPMLCLAEETCVNGLTKLCGWDSTYADGMTMPGGSMSNTFAIQTAINHSFPAFKDEGVVGVIADLMEKYNRTPKTSKPLIITGADSHYSLEKAALACGMGLNSVVKVPCDIYGNMDVEALDRILEDLYEGKGEKSGFPFFVNATAGSTVTGSFDNLNQIADVCEKYRNAHKTALWLHVDGSWGGPILFSSRYRSRMAGIERCDSLTINPHKILNIPHQCSFVLFRKGDVLENNALDAPYLFHANEGDIESDLIEESEAALRRKNARHEGPAKVNFGCGRKGDALKLYIAWQSKGSIYFGKHVEKGIESANRIVQFIKTNSNLSNRLQLAQTESSQEPLFLQVCVRPSLGKNGSVEERSKATQYVHNAIRQQRRFAVDFAPLGKGQGDFIRMVTHPFTSFQDLVSLVTQIADFGDDYLRIKGHSN